jgi:tetratricopeptide (TPR) repeat protein
VCLLVLGDREAARVEVQSGLAAGVSGAARDAGLRALLTLDEPDFEERFAAAVECAARGPEPARAQAGLLAALQRQPEFWPARFFLGIAARRSGDEDAALDAMADVLRIRPGQPDALGEMADLFAARGNPKRALECIDEALLSQRDDAALHAARARYLAALDRPAEARGAVDRAIELDPDEREYRKLRRRIG